MGRKFIYLFLFIIRKKKWYRAPAFLQQAKKSIIHPYKNSNGFELSGNEFYTAIMQGA